MILNGNVEGNKLALAGCFVETDKNYLLIARASKQPISRDRCPFFIRYIHFDIRFPKKSIIIK